MNLRILVLLALATIVAGPAHPYGEGGSAPAAGSVPATEMTSKPPEPPVVKHLAEAATRESDPDVRATAAVSMGQFPQSDMAAATLASLAKDPEQGLQVRSAAAVSLGNQGNAGNAAPLVSLLHDGDPMLRRHAVLGMGLLQSPAVIDSLANSLDDGDDGVRRAAARALAFSGSEAARSALERAARSDANPLVRLESVRTLVQTNGASPDLLAQLSKTDADAEVREQCAAARAGLAARSAQASAATTAATAPASGPSFTSAGPSSSAIDSAIRGAGALAAPLSQRIAIAPASGSVSASGATTSVQTRRRVKLAKVSEEEDGELTDYTAAKPEARETGATEPAAPASTAAAATAPAQTVAPLAPGVTALTSTTALPRTTDTANGESGRAHPGEPIADAISRLSRRLAPGAASADEQLRTMHELAPLIDQAAFQGSKVVPLSPAKGRWFLTAHRKISEHEPLVKSTFVNEQGAMFRAESKQQHMPGSTYVVFRFQDVSGKPGVLNGIGAYTYTRAGNPVFKHFALDGKLDTFSSPHVNAETCFKCHDNKESLNHAKDFTFDTFQKAKSNGTVELMEQARTKVVAAQ